MEERSLSHLRDRRPLAGGHTRSDDFMPFPQIHPALARALAARGYDEPTPVQAAVLEADAENRDLLVSAQTGSGKTVAYGLAFAPTLLGEAERFAPATRPRALVIAPTRELALQVDGELAWLYGETGARVLSCVGGTDARREQRLLAAGCHIVVGTPGRLRDHLNRGQLDLSEIQVVVLDEADEMLDLGFREELEALLDAASSERRTLLFSATFAREILALARNYQNDAVRIDTADRNVPHADIEYRCVRVQPRETEAAVVNLLRWFEARASLVFCHTREAVRHLHAALQERGFAAVALSGELSQTERSQALQALRDGRARVCVATDVAARGLDLPDLALVIHAELPTDRAALLHRSGRTGRAGRKGSSVLVVPVNRRRRAEALIASAGVHAEWSGPPTAEEIRSRDADRLCADPMLSEEIVEEKELAERLMAQHGPEQLAAAFVRLWRSRLPQPEEVSDPGAGRSAEPREARAGTGLAGAPMSQDGAIWFRLPLGRRNNADPRWLLPLICRRGQVTRREIGAIRIFDRETRVEIAAAAVDRFSAAIAATAGGEVPIERAGDEQPAAGPDRSRSPRPFRRDDRRPRTGQGSAQHSKAV